LHTTRSPEPLDHGGGGTTAERFTLGEIRHVQRGSGRAVRPAGAGEQAKGSGAWHLTRPQRR
jgi:hypothetical protein